MSLSNNNEQPKTIRYTSTSNYYNKPGLTIEPLIAILDNSDLQDNVGFLIIS